MCGRGPPALARYASAVERKFRSRSGSGRPASGIERRSSSRAARCRRSRGVSGKTTCWLRLGFRLRLPDVHQLLAAATLGEALEVTSDRSSHVVELALLVHRPLFLRRSARVLPLSRGGKRRDPDGAVVLPDE